MKKYIGLLLTCAALLFCGPVYAQEEAFDLPEMSEEMRALFGEAAQQDKKEFYRLLKRDAALSDYQAQQKQSVYDPRAEKRVTPVRMQQSNTCWAFSSLAAAEQSLVSKGLADPASLDLSEAQLTYFFYHSITDPLGNTAGDGNHNISGNDFMAVGSNTIFSTFALANWVGAAAEELAPFEELGPQTTYADALAYADAAHLQNAYWINFKDVDAVNVIKQMILKYGAAAVNFYWSSRYYNSSQCAYYFPLNSEQANNHSVTLIGWDDTFSRENFNGSNRPAKDGAWIAKNSFGESWGDGGYFYLSYEDSSVNSGNTSMNRARAYVFDFEPADNYDYNYQYDGSAGAYNASHPESEETRIDSGGSIANVFTVQKKGGSHTEVLKAVSFALFDTAVSFQIQIYKDLKDAADPTSGTAMLLSPVTGSTSYAGYYTVPLDIPVTLQDGETFAVVIQLEKESGGQVNFFVDKSYRNGNWISFTNEVKEGQSFRSVEGVWEDLASYGITARIKAFTDAKEAGAKRIVLQGLQQDLDGVYSLDLWSDETYTFQAAVFPTDFEQKLYWESSDSLVAKVDTSGTVRPVAGGTAMLTGRTADGACSVSCKLTVRQRARQIVLSESFLRLEAGESAALTAQLLPENAFLEEILWEVSGEAAKVDNMGVVKAIKRGNAVVRACLRSDPAVCASCEVVVSMPVQEKEEPKTADPIQEPVGESPQTGEGVSKVRKVESAKTADASSDEAALWTVVFCLGMLLFFSQLRKPRV